MKIKFPKNQPEPKFNTTYIVKVPGYCPSGYAFATCDGAWISDAGDNISEYVTEWVEIEEE